MESIYLICDLGKGYLVNADGLTKLRQIYLEQGTSYNVYLQFISSGAVVSVPTMSSFSFVASLGITSILSSVLAIASGNASYPLQFTIIADSTALTTALTSLPSVSLSSQISWTNGAGTTNLGTFTSSVQAGVSGSATNIYSLNGLDGNVLLAGGSNVTLGTSGQTITISSTGGDVSAEAATRAAADTTLQANIAAEATTRASAISTLTTSVSVKAVDSAVVHNTGNETIAGTKTFSSIIQGSSNLWSINAGVATFQNLQGVGVRQEVIDFTDGTYGINLPHGFTVAAGKINVNPDGSLEINNDVIDLNNDGSASFASGNFTVDANGVLTLSSGGNAWMGLGGGSGIVGSDPIDLGADGSARFANGQFTIASDGSITGANGITFNYYIGNGYGTTLANEGGGQGISIGDGAAAGDAAVVLTSTGGGSVYANYIANNSGSAFINNDGSATFGGWSFDGGNNLSDSDGQINCQLLSLSSAMTIGPYDGPASIGIIGDGVDPCIDVTNNGIAPGISIGDGSGSGIALFGNGTISTYSSTTDGTLLIDIVSRSNTIFSISDGYGNPVPAFWNGNYAFAVNAAVFNNPLWCWGGANIGFSGGYSSNDAGISRDAAGVINIGNGTNGDKSGKLQVTNLGLIGLASAPSSPVAGQIYYNSTSGHFFGYNGSTFKQLDN